MSGQAVPATNTQWRPVEQHVTYAEQRFPLLSATPDVSHWPDLPTPDWEQTEPGESSDTAWDSARTHHLELEQRRMQGLRDV